MSRRGRNKAETPVNHERWLITYADLITLLLVFFVIMYSMSKIDSAKYDSLAKALQLQFNSADSILPQNDGLVGDMKPIVVEPTPVPDQELAEKTRKERELQEFKEKLDTYIQANGLESQITVADTEKGIAMTLNDLFLFDLGKADLKAPAYEVLNQLATMLMTLENTKVSIEGHTDNLPVMTGSIFKDNWGLSSERALSVLRYLTAKAGLDEKNFIAAGYADTMPKVDNDTPEHRAQNRRVEITILR